MTAFLETLLRMSAVGGIVIITVIIVRFFLKNAPKKYSYFLWAIVLLRLLCPFTLESPLSSIPHSLARDELLEDLGDSHEGRSNVYYDYMPEYDAAVEAGREPIPNMGVSGGYYVVTGEDGLSPAPAVKPDWTSILAALWICGVAVMLLWGVLGYIRLKRRLRGAMACEKDVYLSCKVDTPFVLGFFFPKIYLPAGISPGEWSYIVAHERCHIRRGDHITRVLAFAALAVHWFNPLVWLAFILSGRDMELSCDEAVLRSMGAELRQAYSASLLRLATGRSPLSAMPLAFGEGDPKERIRNLAKWRKPTRAMIIAALIVCAVAAVCLLTDPVAREAQIKVDGIVYTYIHDSEADSFNGDFWRIGDLKGIVHRSDSEPEQDYYGTNLDEKYAGQPIYTHSSGLLLLYDERGHFLVFEATAGEKLSGPTELVRGDFNHDGESDFLIVTEHTDRLTLALVDSRSSEIIWREDVSRDGGDEKCFLARREDGLDYILRYTFAGDGYCEYRRFFIGDEGEVEAETGRSPVDSLLEENFTDPEAISLSMPENGTFLLSTYGGEVVIGPVKSGRNTSEEESFCKAAFRELAEAETLHYIWKMYIDGEFHSELPGNEGWFHGDDWLHQSNIELPSGRQSSTIMEAHGEQYVLGYIENERTMLARFTEGEYDAYGRTPLENFLLYDLEFVSKTETEAGTVYSFTVLFEGENTFNTLQSFVFGKSGRLMEARFETDAVAELTDGEPRLSRQMTVISFPETSSDECRKAIDEAYEEIMAEARVTGFDKIEAEISSEEALCREALEKVLAAESAQITLMYGLGIITNRVTLLYEGDDWYWSDFGQGYSTGIVCVDGDYCAFEQTSGGAVWERCEHTPIIMPNPFALNDYPREFTGREEMDGGYYMLHFTADPVAAGLLYAPNAVGEAEESFMFSADGELVSISRSVPVNDRGDGGEQLFMETIAVEYYAPAVLREPIMAHYNDCVNSIAEREKAVTENAVYDNGGEVIAVPYGESVVIDLDGVGAEEVLCIKASDIYGFDSLTVNGEECIDVLERWLGTELNPEPDQFPNYYIVRTYEGDYSPKICVFDNGPSGDPRTHFFTFNHGSSLQYHGYVPCHVSKLSFDGNHCMTGPARLGVFQTWYAEHTWYLPNNGTKLSEVERDFYYVEDFEFISYHIGDTYYPQSKYGPLLCDVYAYEKMDISADAEVLKEGTELSILGTDNAEWILVADRSGEEYYLHLSGINAYSIDTPQGEAMGNAVFHGLHYFD